MIFHTASDYERLKAEAYFNRLVAQKKDIEVKEKKKSDKRTLDQNALFHLWVSVIADDLGYTDKEARKSDVTRTIHGQKEDVNRLTGEVIQVDYRTSEMTVSELASFMDKMKAWASTDLGIYLPYFGDPGYEEMINAYGHEKV